MNIFLITQDDNLLLPLSLEIFLAAYGREISGAVVCNPIRRNKRHILSGYGLVGTYRMWLMTVRRKIGKTDVRSLLTGQHIPIHDVPDINAPSFIDVLKALNIDLVVSVACPKIFKKALIDAPRKGCINVHGSLLPAYRGRDIAFWVLYNREEKTGVTVHYIDEKIDGGAVIVQKELSINPLAESVFSLYRKTIPLSGKALVEAVGLIKSGRVSGIKSKAASQHDRYPLYHEPTKAQIYEFKKRGGRFI